ncbi:helix-turn-helix domain-containing protein [Saccharomonospora sp. NPDC046836]|uniref:TetR/AcrR family transcriptional regulator n=1 Tax=Saccharomonospora sp. NPDC046836 TaxID=3156921 RepID=UPI0033C6E50D
MATAKRTDRSTGPSTRTRIIDAAAEVMASKGLANTTTKEIARVAGYSEATLYKHFRDKAELCLMVLRERLAADFIDTLSGFHTRAGQATVRENLLDVALRALSFYRQSAPMMGAVFAEPALLAHHQEVLRSTEKGPHLAIVALTGYLRAEQGLGRVAPDVRAEALAALLLGACFQRAFFTRFVGEHIAGQPDDDFAATLVDALPLG